MTVAWQSEIDEYASKVLRKHWPDVPNHGDIRQMRGEDIEWVDVITAGFPCQPVSLAGRRLGDADERWMWPETIRIIREVRPRWVLAENVPGLLSAHAGRLFGRILRDLAESGFDAEWQVLSACSVGANHIRDRIWIVAYPGSRRHRPPEETVFTRWPSSQSCSWWSSEPRLCRVADGVSHRVDRLRALGNAIVPQVPELILRRIVEIESNG